MYLNKYFLITIDTEGDNLWGRPRTITTKNALYLDRFQTICNKYKFKPTYLVNYEMSKSKTFQEFGKSVVASGNGEIGMHLHAWNSPPHYPISKDDFENQPFLIEYPYDIMRNKIGYMTEYLRDTFNCNIVSHRAGRWAINSNYIKILNEFEYTVDCSVTPYVSWKKTIGSPAGNGGPDYSKFSSKPYFLDHSSIDREGDSNVLEVPMTIMPTIMYYFKEKVPQNRYVDLFFRLTNRFCPTVIWLRPNGRNRKHMAWLIRNSVNNQTNYVMFMLHSSELMPGGSSRFNTNERIEMLYEDIEYIFEMASKYYSGITLGNYRETSFS